MPATDTSIARAGKAISISHKQIKIFVRRVINRSILNSSRDSQSLDITTQRTPEVYFARDLITALNATLRYCPVLATEPEHRLAAIIDFTFNLGAGRLQTSTLRRRVNQQDWAIAAQELRRWVYGGGVVLPGLVIRREAEVALVL